LYLTHGGFELSGLGQISYLFAILKEVIVHLGLE
jgi:hypothetical protein